MVEGSRKFFSENSAQNWNFINYFNAILKELNKFKKYNIIKIDYKHDFDSIKNMRSIPEEITAFAQALNSENIVILNDIADILAYLISFFFCLCIHTAFQVKNEGINIKRS